MSPFPSNRSATTAHSDRLNGDSELSGEYARQWSQALFSSSQRKTPHKVHNVSCGSSETSSGESSSSSKVISRARASRRRKNTHFLKIFALLQQTERKHGRKFGNDVEQFTRQQEQVFFDSADTFARFRRHSFCQYLLGS